MTKSKPESNKGQHKPLESKRITKGPEPERLKIEGKWENAVDTALKAKRPPTGWPK
jgi:hypothetical protein